MLRIKQERSKEDEIMRTSLTEEEVEDCFDKLRQFTERSRVPGLAEAESPRERRVLWTTKELHS